MLSCAFALSNCLCLNMLMFVSVRFLVSYTLFLPISVYPYIKSMMVSAGLTSYLQMKSYYTLGPSLKHVAHVKICCSFVMTHSQKSRMQTCSSSTFDICDLVLLYCPLHVFSGCLSARQSIATDWPPASWAIIASACLLFLLCPLGFLLLHDLLHELIIGYTFRGLC